VSTLDAHRRRVLPCCPALLPCYSCDATGHFSGSISGGSGGVRSGRLMWLICALCRGSFAVVKEGRHKASGTVVAIKIVDKKDAVFDPESLEQEVSSACFPQIGHFCWHVFCVSLTLLGVSCGAQCRVIRRVHAFLHFHDHLWSHALIVTLLQP
jgi:hypothetical protein